MMTLNQLTMTTMMMMMMMTTFLAGTHFDDGLIASLQQYRLQIIVIFTKLGS